MSTFDFGWDDTTELYEAVLQALGAASVCWDFDTLIFQPDRASAIGDALLDFINARYMPVPPTPINHRYPDVEGAA